MKWYFLRLIDESSSLHGYNNRMTEFAQLAAGIGVELTPLQEEQFERYLDLLVHWNARVNLTAIREAGAIRTKHFLDSLSCLPVIFKYKAKRIVDVGTGAGFPGLALKIAAPELRLTLVESVQKKAEFCEKVVAALGLQDVDVQPVRAEELGRDPAHRESHDMALARAVAEVRVLVEYLLPLVRLGGRLLLQKGQGVHAEVMAAEKALSILGGRVLQISTVEVPGLADERYLVLVEKVQQTPDRYPRRAGMPAKRPL